MVIVMGIDLVLKHLENVMVMLKDKLKTETHWESVMDLMEQDLILFCFGDVLLLELDGDLDGY